MDRDDWEIDECARDRETFRRIHLLTKRGFVPSLGSSEVEDAIWFDHPGKHPPLILYFGGMLVCTPLAGTHLINPEDGMDGDRIHNRTPRDADIFDKWLQTVSPPTWWERGRDARIRFFVVIFFLVASLFSYGVMWLLEKLVRAWLNS